MFNQWWRFFSTTLNVTNYNIFNKNTLAAGLSTTKDFNIIQIRRKGKILLPDDYTELKENDDVVVFAKTTVINELAEKFKVELKIKRCQWWISYFWRTRKW